MTRKELQNLFPTVSGHFLDRIDRTMEEIEAMNRNRVKRIRWVSRPVLIAAIVFILTVATALAAVLGNHALEGRAERIRAGRCRRTGNGYPGDRRLGRLQPNAGRGRVGRRKTVFSLHRRCAGGWEGIKSGAVIKKSAAAPRVSHTLNL